MINGHASTTDYPPDRDKVQLALTVIIMLGIGWLGWSWATSKK